MHIRVPKDWELPESAVTPERDYALRPRRDFLKSAAVAGGAAEVDAAVQAALDYLVQNNRITVERRKGGNGRTFAYYSLA